MKAVTDLISPRIGSQGVALAKLRQGTIIDKPDNSSHNHHRHHC